MKKRLFLIAACIIIAVSLFFSPAFAAYSWVDDNGVFHITDYPKPVKREEPKDMAPEAATPPAAPEVKQSPAQTVPVAPTPPPVPVAATAPMSTGTPTMRPAAPLSQLTPTPAGHDVMATAATVSLLTTTATTTAPLPAMQEQPQATLPVSEEPMSPAGIAAFVMAFFMVFLLLFVGMYVYFSLCLYLIAKKLNVSAPWTAWVPIVNIWTILQAAGKPCWWVLLFFIPFVGFIVIIYVWMCIVENLGRNKWMGLLILIPIVSLVYIGVLAFSKQERLEDPHEQVDDISGQEWKPSEDSSEEHE
jgi:hypothetical protein